MRLEALWSPVLFEDGEETPRFRMMRTPTPKLAPFPRTILIVDDHALFRRGLAALIESEAGLAVCVEAATGQAALRATEEHHPDLVIVDLELGPGSGLDLIRELKVSRPEIPVLVLSMHQERVYAERSLRAGARGYVAKDEFDATILMAIRRVLDGELYMSGTLMAQLAARYVDGRRPARDSSLEILSDRELQVFRLIGGGQTTRQIAEILRLSIKTIESHREHIKQKLSLTSAAELAQSATQWVESSRSG